MMLDLVAVFKPSYLALDLARRLRGHEFTNKVDYCVVVMAESQNGIIEDEWSISSV